MDIRRVIEALDKLNVSGKAEDGAMLLEKWRFEAQCEHDEKAELGIVSEMLGQYRKLGYEKEGLAACADAIKMVDDMGISSTATGATILINAATTLKTFGKVQESYELFKKCETVYKNTLSPDDYRMSALYNNMALTLADLGMEKDAEEYFLSALSWLDKIENSNCDKASTWCNMAELYDRFSGSEEKINSCMEKAYSLLTAEDTPKDSYLSYTIECCLPAFGYFGLFLYSIELKKILGSIK